MGLSVDNTSYFNATNDGMAVASSGMACGLKFYKDSRTYGNTQITNFYNPS